MLGLLWQEAQEGSTIAAAGYHTKVRWAVELCIGLCGQPSHVFSTTADEHSEELRGHSEDSHGGNIG